MGEIADASVLKNWLGISYIPFTMTISSYALGCSMVALFNRIGDTVGDPLKNTVGPSLDILIKIMATVSLICVSIFGKYNLLDLFSKWFG